MDYNFKKLKTNRCPWCGEYYLDDDRLNIISSRYHRLCDKCNNWGVVCYIWGESLISIIAIIYIVRRLYEISPFFIFIMIPYLWIIFNKAPHFRTLRETWFGFGSVPKEKKLGYIKVRWYSFIREGGILFPHLRIWSNMIFPICFINNGGKLITNVGCVRFRRRWGIHPHKYKLTLITDVLKKDKIPLQSKFYVYNDGEVIGEGILYGK